jgi:hypothetical protein
MAPKSSLTGYADRDLASSPYRRGYLTRYAHEASWREDNRRVNNGF